jgi:hypothetical protein
LFDDEEKMLNLSLVVLNYTAKLKFGLFFHHIQAWVLLGAHNPPKKGGKKRNKRRKNFTPTAARVLLDHH